MQNICHAIKTIAERNKGVQILYPVHPNPNVSKVVFESLQNHPRILLAKPLPYEQFVTAMKQAHLILSDSGGVQEEAPSVQTPVLVLRDTTERPEAIHVGAAKLVGTNSKKILEATETLLKNRNEYQKMIVHESPFGDGKASFRIADALDSFLKN